MKPCECIYDKWNDDGEWLPEARKICTHCRTKWNREPIELLNHAYDEEAVVALPKSVLLKAFKKGRML